VADKSGHSKRNSTSPRRNRKDRVQCA
jgi:hypothetical protein